MSAEGVTKIVNNLNKKPHIKTYFSELIDRGAFWESHQIHPEYLYPDLISIWELWPHLGIFYDYPLRRELYYLRQEEIMDDRAELCKAAFEKYNELEQEINNCCGSFIKFCEFHKGRNLEKFVYVDDRARSVLISSSGKSILEKFLASYEIFKNGEIPTRHILDHIFNTSMLHMFSYNDPVLECRSEFINMSNIEDILQYAETLSSERCILFNPKIEGNFFHGEADLIFHDCVMDVKTSKYYFKKPYDQDEKFLKAIYQMLYYAAGIFIQSGEEKRIFKVYNPLLGVLYILYLPQLHFEELCLIIDNEPY